MTKRLHPQKRPTYAYAQLWRLIDGAVRDCFSVHPEYIPANRSEKAIRNSIVKRVTGLTYGYAVQTARGRSVAETAAEKAMDVVPATSDACADSACIQGEEARSSPFAEKQSVGVA